MLFQIHVPPVEMFLKFSHRILFHHRWCAYDIKHESRCDGGWCLGGPNKPANCFWVQPVWLPPIGLII